MNLLNKYIPDYSGHIQHYKYCSKRQTIEIVFFDRPEDFQPVLKLVFNNVIELSYEQLEPAEDDYIELVIGLDVTNEVYCLHTDIREVTFSATNLTSYDLTNAIAY